MVEEAQPSRVIMRVMTEFMINAVRAHAEPHGGDMLETVMFSTVLNAGLNHLARGWAEARGTFEALGRLADNQMRPVSINAIAQSFGVPYETARGAVGRLVRRGYCRKVPGGVITPVEALLRPEVVQADHTVANLLDTAMTRLNALGLDFDLIARMDGLPAPPLKDLALGPPPRRQLSWIATDFLIRTVENLALTVGDFTSSLVFAGAMIANARDITYNPAFAWTYFSMDTPPPDDLRCSISIRGLSELIGMPFETVRRHVNRLVDCGELVRKDDGVMVPLEVLQSERLRKNAAVAVLRFARMIADLKRAGYVFGRSGEDFAPEQRAVRPAG